MWQIPETDVRALPDVRGKDLLEFGCGTCQWSIVLAGTGARRVGLDFSDQQLQHARRLMDAVTTYRSQHFARLGAALADGPHPEGAKALNRALFALACSPCRGWPCPPFALTGSPIRWTLSLELYYSKGSGHGCDPLVPPREAAVADVARSRSRYGRVLVDQF
ncbi:MAG TPA: class I SAM-dependent methyltransferase [Nakamurella sp.]|nr:class I SAM-dependent methyltransferase [Nakamurella sp.]